MGAAIGLGIHTDNPYYYAGAAAIYWAALMDGVVNYDKSTYPQPGKATLYSILLPGLGQVYNGELWKIPIYWGGILGSYHYYSVNNKNYRRYKRIYNEATSTSTEYDGPISSETALYYRDVFRRYRDYSIVCIAGFYLLQAIDANVFAYMHDFDVSKDLTLEIEPTVTTSADSYAFGPLNPGSVGLTIGLRF